MLHHDIYKTGSAPLQKITQLTFFSKSSLYNILNKYVQFNTKPEEQKVHSASSGAIHKINIVY